MEFNVKKTIDMELAKNALTETEYSILTTLLNKVENYKIKQHVERMAMLGKIVFGPPGIGKTNTEIIANIIKEHGFKIVPINFHHHAEPQDPPSNYGADFPEPFVKASEIFANAVDKAENFNNYAKIQELRMRNIPGDVIIKMVDDAFSQHKDVSDYISELEKKSKEAGVSLTMYVRQGMNK